MSVIKQALLIYKRLNAPPPPENSILLRVLVSGSVLSGVLGIAFERGFSISFSFLALFGILVGNLVSWLRRRKNNWQIKLILSFLLFIAFSNYLRELSTYFYDPRYPLARLFILILVLHSFDLPARRDLLFSLASSLILVGTSGALSISLKFIPFFLSFIIFSAFYLLFDQVSTIGLEVDNIFLKYKKVFFPFGLFSILLITLLSLLIFPFIPRSSGWRVRNFPFKEAEERLIPNFGGGVVNPAYPYSLGKEFSPFNPQSYFGFNPYLNLNYRGKLSEEVALIVKTDEPSYYRGLVFDLYDGKGWESSDKTPKEISTSFQPFSIPLEEISSYYRTSQVIQTFFIIKEQPNVIFAAYQPESLYFSALSIWKDKFSSLRSPFTLPEDMVYTVISLAPRWSAGELKRFKGETLVDQRYLQLPSNFPQRVKDLAKKITLPYSNSFDKILAIENYLKKNYRYNLEIEPSPPKSDVVDYFLFEKKEGYCEHFASALTLMCRAVGIPARLVTGYTEGYLNPFTGYYEIKISDAHAWTEIYFPGFGWLTFDPTPGFEAPQAISSKKSFLVSYWQYIKKQIKKIPIFASLQRKLIFSLATLKRLASNLSFSPSRGYWISFLTFFIFLSGYFWVKREKAKRKKAIAPSDKIGLYFKNICEELDALGFKRKDWETPSEFAKIVNKEKKLNEFFDFVKFFERDRFSPNRLEAKEIKEAEICYQAIKEKLKFLKAK